MAAVTFCDVVVSHQPFTYGLLFHELVHVEQYRQLGIPRFAELYVRGFLSGGWYDGLRFWTNQKTDAISKRIDLSGIEIDHQRSMNRTVCTSFEKGDGAIYILSRPSNEHPPGSGLNKSMYRCCSSSSLLQDLSLPRFVPSIMSASMAAGGDAIIRSTRAAFLP